MKATALVAAISVSMTPAAAAQGTRGRSPDLPSSAQARMAQAYEQFLLGHHLEADDDVSGAIAAYRRAIELAPLAADIPAELAALYLRHDRVADALATAEQALAVAPANPEANRVLGMVYAGRVDMRPGPRARSASDENVAKAIQHLELAVAQPASESDPTAHAALARLYLQTGAYDKAIALLADLVRRLPSWQPGSALLLQAYVGAGRTNDAIDLLESRAEDDPNLLPTLASFYEQTQKWKEAARAYERAIAAAPRNADLKVRYAQVLVNAGSREEIAKARDVLTELVATGASDTRALYLLSQASRRMGDLDAAEAAARRVIALQSASPWGYYALAEALEARRQYQAIVDALAPAIAALRAQPGDHASDLGMLLPHIGFAYQEIGEHDQAIASFEEARRLSPQDASLAAYLVGAHLAARKYTTAAELARTARATHPNDLRLTRLEAQALRQSGRSGEGIALLEGALKAHADDPMAYIALAELLSDAARGPQAVTLLEEAGARFPSNTSILFELGAVFEKQKDFADAEAAFQRVLSREPDHAAALNYLGYMLADRGERLDESVALLKRALAIEPNNGSYLDSLGWAYYKSDQLQLAEPNLRRAAEQLRTNSVIQDHYGALLFKLGRYDEAIVAWTRALAGDGDAIDRDEIDRKIRAARQKLPRP